MKAIFEQIAARKLRFDKRPIFEMMRDEQRTPKERLAFVPYLSHFIMSFGDLYRFVLPEHPPRDRYQELVNIHLSEEETHFGWFLADLANMDIDPEVRFTDALRFIWGDATRKSRMLAYQMCRLGFGASSLRKLVLVQAIESTGRVALESLVHPGNAIVGRAKKRLVYFGKHHLDTEQQHTLEEDGMRNSLESIVLDKATRAEMIGVVDEVFHHFTEFADEAFAYATKPSTLFPVPEAQAPTLPLTRPGAQKPGRRAGASAARREGRS
jgi:hypothetical protein